MSKIIAVFMSVITTFTGLFSSIFGGGIVIKPTDERLNDNESIIVASYNTAAPWGSVLKGTGSKKRAKLFSGNALSTVVLKKRWFIRLAAVRKQNRQPPDPPACGQHRRRQALPHKHR